MLDCHITDHDLERYYLGMVEEEGELARLEEHLVACPECVARAEHTELYVDALRSALLLTGESNYMVAY